MYHNVHHGLFTIARTWKQPRCPSADEWIGKLWYIYTMEYYSAIKKNTFESVLMSISWPVHGPPALEGRREEEQRRKPTWIYWRQLLTPVFAFLYSKPPTYKPSR